MKEYHHKIIYYTIVSSEECRFYFWLMIWLPLMMLMLKFDSFAPDRIPLKASWKELVFITPAEELRATLLSPVRTALSHVIGSSLFSFPEEFGLLEGIDADDGVSAFACPVFFFLYFVWRISEIVLLDAFDC